MVKMTIKIESISSINQLDEKNSMITEGVFYKKYNLYHYEYDEYLMENAPPSKSTLVAGDDYVSLSRSGSANSVIMYFKKGETFNSFYETPYGTFDLKIETCLFEKSLDEEGTGYILLRYILHFGNKTDSLNQLKLCFMK